MKTKPTKTNLKPFVFVLMPFRPELDDIYQLGIKASCESSGAYCERVDEQIFTENILERVYSQISKADIIISEMTGRNPNVFYETGYAHALNKRVILLTQSANDIPFDLKQYPHIIYGGKISGLKTELEKKIKWCIDNPIESIKKADLDLELTINGKIWREGLKIPIFFHNPSRFEHATATITFELEIGLHNTSNLMIDSSNYHLSLITPADFSREIYREGIDSMINNGQHTIIRLHEFGRLYPDDWSSIAIQFSIDRRYITSNPSNKLTIKLYSELVPKDYNFTVNFLHEE